MPDLTSANEHLLAEIDHLVMKGDYDLALEQVQMALQEELSLPLTIEITFIKTRIFEESGNYSEALMYAEQSLNYSLEHDSGSYIFRSMVKLARMTWRLGELQHALEWCAFAQQQYANLPSEGQQAVACLFSYSDNFNTMGNIYRLFGEINMAMEYFASSLEIGQKLENERLLAGSLNNIGIIYYMRGEYLQSLDFFEAHLLVRRQQGNPVFIGTALNNMGEAYRMRGELELALDYYNQSLSYKKEVGNLRALASTVHNIALVYYSQANHQEALNQLEKALKYSLASGTYSQMSAILFDAIRMNAGTSNLVRARKFLHQLKDIDRQSQSKIHLLHVKLATGIVLKYEARLRQIMEAETIFQEIIKSEIIDYNLTIIALKYLAEILLIELKVTNNPIVLDEVKELVNRLVSIALSQNIHQILVEAYILQSKLAMLEGRVGDVTTFLEQAESIADKKGFNRLKKKILLEKELLLSEIEKWEGALEQLPLHERMDKLKLVEYLKDVQNDLF